MRSITAAELAVLQATTRQVTWRVKMENGSGTMVDLSTWIESIVIEEDVDQPAAGCTLEFRRDSQTTESLSPLREDSTLNRLDDGVTYAPQLQLNRKLTIEVATTAIGAFPSGSDFKLLFDGKVHDFDVARSPVVVVGRDKFGRFVDRWVETEQTYGSTIGVPLEDVMQNEINDVLGPGEETLVVMDPPSYDVSPTFRQQKQSLADALLALQQLRGFDVRFWWDDATLSFRPTLREPDRTKTVPDYTFSPSGYYDITRLEFDLTGIRNAIKGSFPLGDGTRDELTVTDADSILEFDRQFLFLQEGDTSPVNTSGEMTTMLNAALSDLKDPKADKEIDMPFFWPMQLTDLYRFQANRVHYNTDQDLAVVSYRHELSREKQRTYPAVRGKPCGGYLTWLKRARGQLGGGGLVSRAPQAIITPLDTETDSLSRPLRFDYKAGSGGGGTIISWEIWIKTDFAAEALFNSGNGSVLPLDTLILRSPRSDKAVRYVVTDTATGLSDTATITVPSSRLELTDLGEILRDAPFDDGGFALLATQSDGTTRSSTPLGPQGSIIPAPTELSLFIYNAGGPAFFKMWIAWTWAAFTIYKPDGTTIAVPASSAIAAPPAASLSQVAGGGLSARTRFARVGYVKNGLVHRVGAESSLAISANNLLRIASPAAVNGYDGWIALIGSASNGEFFQQLASSPIAFGTNFTEATTGFLTTGVPYDDTKMPNAVTAIGLDPSLTYYYYPHWDVDKALLAFPDAGQTAKTAAAASYQNGDGRIGLSPGAMSATTPSAGFPGNGAGGGGRLL